MGGFAKLFGEGEEQVLLTLRNEKPAEGGEDVGVIEAACRPAGLGVCSTKVWLPAEVSWEEAQAKFDALEEADARAMVKPILLMAAELGECAFRNCVEEAR